MDPQGEIEELVSFDGRWPGTDAERRAAVHLQQRLATLGRQVEVEPIHVRPNFPVVTAITRNAGNIAPLFGGK